MPVMNYYDILQVSPKAHHLVISRAYRVLAAMYHPDNQQTGDVELFRQVCEAYEVLSDPQRRKEYDEKILESEKPPPETPTVRLAEDDLPKPRTQQEIRDSILRVLYEHRIADPHKPELQLQVLAAVIGLEPEEMEFARWYLLEKGYIRMSSSADFQITVPGVDYVESRLLPQQSAPPSERTPLPG
jgi:curved DNA-binding protein CbpA